MTQPVAADVSVEPEVPTPTARAVNRGDKRIAFWFLLPTVLGLGLFCVVPILASIVLAFFRWDVISNPKWTGLDNFKSLFTDPTLRSAFMNTGGFVVATVVLQIGVALGLALLVQGKMPGWLRSTLRSIFFFPIILSAASVSIIMSYLFNEQFGLVNTYLHDMGFGRVPWFTNGFSAQVMITLIYVWQNAGFTFLLFLGGLAGIPQDVYEAASIDGATGWRKFVNITLPLLSPTMLVASVMAIIAALQIFDQPYVMTQGGPGNSTETVVMVIYQDAFGNLQFGTASAVGVVLTIVIMAVTALQFRLSNRYVYYS